MSEPMTYCDECWNTAKTSEYYCGCGSCVVCQCEEPTQSVLPNGKVHVTV